MTFCSFRAYPGHHCCPTCCPRVCITPNSTRCSCSDAKVESPMQERSKMPSDEGCQCLPEANHGMDLVDDASSSPAPSSSAVVARKFASKGAQASTFHTATCSSSSRSTSTSSHRISFQVEDSGQYHLRCRGSFQSSRAIHSFQSVLYQIWRSTS